MFKSNFKREWNTFWSLMQLQTKAWLMNYTNIFLGVFVSLYTILCWVGFKSNDPFLLISGVCVVVIRNSMYIFLRTLNEWRDKKFWERTKKTSMSVWTRHYALISFNILSTAVIAGVIILITIALFPSQITLIGQANQLMVWTGLILLWLTCYFVALVVHQNVGHSKGSNMIGLLLYVAALQFLGLGFPFETITSIEWLNYAMYAHPFRYSVNIIQAGFVNSPDLVHTYIGHGGVEVTVNFGYNSIRWLPYVIAISAITIFMVIYFIRSKTMKSIAQRVVLSNSIVNINSVEYIKMLKLSQSVDELKQVRKGHKSKRGK
ncbi:hypothetical protein [[Acholeplasma] multilocale]|uniref:hypothetical protein n=1 Tax=[Acholeplasma] multilocale TaxID=264638 RepID=UPI00047A410E|nr:hypothetical protein [[Acholeplasma] multilocale]